VRVPAVPSGADYRVRVVSTWAPGLFDQSDAQAWIDGAAPNHGWIVIGDETELGGTIVCYYSSDSGEACNGQRPRLTVSYFTPTRPPDSATRSSWSLFQ